MLDDILFTVLAQVTADDPQEVLGVLVFGGDPGDADSAAMGSDGVSWSDRLGLIGSQRSTQRSGLISAVHISFPLLDGSIEKISYSIDDDYLNLIVEPGQDGLVFRQDDIVFTQTVFSEGNYLPKLSKKKLSEMAKERDTKISRLAVSIPAERDAVDKVSYTLAGNYVHIHVQGPIGMAFDRNGVRFKRD